MHAANNPIGIIIRLGAVVVAATLCPLAAGLWLDERLRTAPWCTLVALIVGVVGAMMAVYRVVSGSYGEST